jgi:predicted acylesterase/phospholipase RssA
LQGGGAHGAFTWAVLDRLLEELRLRIEGISGTSAGAMNAAVLVDGYAEGGATGARARLERFWESVSVLSAGTLDSFPHNGAVVTLLSVCGVSHREGYFDLFMVAIVGALIALAAVILLGSAFGSF